MRLLEEGEHQKLIVTREILKERLHEVRKDNMLKEQKLLNIKKWKEHTLGEVHALHEVRKDNMLKEQKLLNIKNIH